MKTHHLRLIGSLLAGILTAPGAAAQTQSPTWIFVHTPNSGTNHSASDVAAGLDEILDIVEADFRAANGRAPKVCLFGYVGPWDTSGGGSPGNLAGTAANLLGNQDANDNRCSNLVEVSYCGAKETLKEVLMEHRCDIVLGLGEGGTQFNLESHGSPTRCTPDCNGQSGPPVCAGGGCTGTDWDQPASGGGGTLGDAVVNGYMGMIPTSSRSPGGNQAGGFLCGWFCCAKCCILDELAQCTDGGVIDGSVDPVDAGGRQDAGDREEDAGPYEEPVDPVDDRKHP